MPGAEVSPAHGSRWFESRSIAAVRSSGWYDLRGPALAARVSQQGQLSPDLVHVVLSPALSLIEHVRSKHRLGNSHAGATRPDDAVTTFPPCRSARPTRSKLDARFPSKFGRDVGEGSIHQLAGRRHGNQGNGAIGQALLPYERTVRSAAFSQPCHIQCDLYNGSMVISTIARVRRVE